MKLKDFLYKTPEITGANRVIKLYFICNLQSLGKTLNKLVVSKNLTLFSIDL